MFPIIYSDEFLKHDTGTFHPESPQRLRAIVETLNKVTWSDQLDWQLPTPLSQRDVIPYLQKLHTPSYCQRVEQLAKHGGGMLDMDTPVSPKSYQVALLAVSAWLDGIDRVLEYSHPAFVLARPPGHHALSSTGMGFCLFSNAAIAAYYALEKPNLKRVAIVDWDVHHGNGTQALVENHPSIVYCSLHQYPAYPGTGKASEEGKYHNVLNLPMKAGSTLAQYQTAFEKEIIPFLTAFNPELIIISAGYDANENDPLAGIALHPADYGIFTEYLLKITPRLLFGLEGGYDLDSLAQSVAATIEKCLLS